MAEGTHFALAQGAAAAAPTAPHATPPAGTDRSGPARFWSSERVRVGLVVGVLGSFVFHYLVAPFSILPGGPPVEVHDQAGELTIPVDFISEGTGDQPGGKSAGQGPNGAGPGGEGDASLADGGPEDGGGSGAKDGGPKDGGTVEDDAGPSLAVVDGGVGRDPQALLGAAAVSAGPNNVTLMVNFVELRKHPEAARLGMVLAGIPQWRQFMADASGAPLLDPMRDADWMIIMGPSLLETQNDAVFVHYATPDAQVDRVIDAVSHHYARGGPIDLGVRGVKAWRAFADRGERVFLRPQPHLVVIIPATHASAFARTLASNPVVPHVHAGEAMSLRALRPGGSVSLIPQDISEMRMWIVPRPADGGGDLYAEGDCPDAAAAQVDATSVKDFIQQKNSFAVKLVTAGFFNNVDVNPVGNQVHLHISATQDQIDALVILAGGRVNITLPPRH